MTAALRGTLSPYWIDGRSWLDYITKMVLSVDRVDLHSFLPILNETSTVVDLGMSDGEFARAMVSRSGAASMASNRSHLCLLPCLILIEL
jgi:hypothetical protein